MYGGFEGRLDVGHARTTIATAATDDVTATAAAAAAATATITVITVIVVIVAAGSVTCAKGLWENLYGREGSELHIRGFD